MEPEPSLRVVVLSCGPLGGEVARRIARLPEVAAVLLLTAPFDQRDRTLRERVTRSIRYDGLWDTLRAAARRVGGRAQTDTTAEVDLPPSSAAAPLDHHRVPAFEDPQGMERLRRFDPDLGVVAGTYILPARVFDLPRLGSINVHSGKVPEYRGSAPAFWEMYRGEDAVGVTIHGVTADLDGGPVYRRTSCPLDPAPAGDPLAYVERYRAEVLRPAGIRLLCETVRDIAHGRDDPRPQDGTEGRIWPRPTRRDVWALRWRVLLRRAGKRAQDLAGRLVYGLGLQRWLLGNRSAVVLFHRVAPGSDANPLSTSEDAFSAYCRFFHRHFDVIPLGELLDRLESGADLAGRLVLTFDDGYRDNHEVARPVLERWDLPCSFFVATGFIGTDRIPWWDEHPDRDVDWMDWEEVASLAADGFEVGVHTHDHVDLGTASPAVVREELRTARREIEEATGRDTRLFSYPFGGPDNITEANREVVEEEGFRCCLSAFGGLVGPETSPFRLPRVPVSDWYLSPHHLGFTLLLEESVG